jgi:hypothetical protein
MGRKIEMSSPAKKDFSDRFRWSIIECEADREAVQ